MDGPTSIIPGSTLDPDAHIVTALAAGLSFVDLLFLGRPHAIATVVIDAPGGLALIDPGPSTCLATLERALAARGARMADVTDILLTHVHLDHAGATGTILRAHPDIQVAVHERGAPHLVDPSKLVASASRLWPNDMDRLWGEVLPVPQDRLRVLLGGERIEAGGRTLDVAYTPGHASHHVSFFDAGSGIAFVGDTGGMSVDGGYVMAPTPPPDIDLELWRASVDRIEAWSPESLFLTHFGPVRAPRPHLRTLMAHLETTAGLVRTSLQGEGDDESRSARFAEDLRRELRRHMSEAQVAAYESSAPLHLLWLGLARYWRKRAG
jgi:glyoxylase-like metal-dependent hydrolase (beta-lactamase superfamily II)